jgi:hypothetical protein
MNIVAPPDMVAGLRFLLEQAPMLNAPTDLMGAAHAVTPFAYIHPDTFGMMLRMHVVDKPSYRIAPSPTAWIMTTLMPRGRVIYTPNKMPR